MKVSNAKLLHKQTKRTLVEVIISLRKQFDQQTEQLRVTNLKLAQVRVLYEDLKKKCSTIVDGAQRKTRSLKNTIRRRRKVSHA